MILENVFTTPIFYDFLNIDVKLLEEYAYKKQKQSEGRIISNRLGWQSNDIQGDKELKNLIFLIQERLTTVAEHSNLKHNVRIIIDNVWININKKYSYNTIHDHTNSYFSGVFYVKALHNSGKINFFNPLKVHKFFFSEEYINNYNNFTSSIWNYDPEPCKLILFPSWIEHSVDQNLSDSDRISISFNTNLVLLQK